MGELLGRHGDVVDEILGRLQQLCDGDADEPRAMVLVAESGAGKSRIIREVYERLRARQPDPGYWPALVDIGRSAETQGSDPMASRKMLGPDACSFVWRPEAVPSFGWWAFECELMQSGASVDVVGAVYPQLKAHLPALGWAWRQKAALGRRLGRNRPRALHEFQSAIREGGADMLADLLGVAVPGLSVVTRWAGHGYESVVDRHHLRKSLESNVRPADRAHASAAEELAEAITSLALPGLPQIVVVEDMHRMGHDLAELLSRLIRPVKDRPVLVIGAVWPEGQTQPEYGTWIDRAKSAGYAQVVTVPTLGSDDLVTLVRRHAPATDDLTAHALAERMPNPHFLSLWLTSAQIQRRIAAGSRALILDQGDLDRLPSGVQDVLRMRWKEIPAAIRGALIRAVLARQRDSDTVATFLPTVVADAADRAGLGFDCLAAQLARAVDPVAWCQTSEHAQWLRELDLQRLVQEESEDEELGLSPSETRRLRESARDVLRRLIDQHRDGLELPLDDPTVTAASTWLVDLSESDVEGATQADHAARWTLARRAATSYDYRLAIRLGWGARSEDHRTELDRRALMTSWLGEAGRVEEAAAQLQALLEEMYRVRGVDDPQTLRTRGNLARWLGEAGRVEEAAAQLQALLEDMGRVLGVDHPDTLRARSNLAHRLGEAGRVKEAATQSECLLEDRIRVLGADHPDTLRTRGNLARWLGEAGLVEAAAQQCQSLLKDCIRILGFDHPDTLQARGNLARWLGEAGLVEETTAQFQALLTDRTRILGADHPETLRTRGNLARWLPGAEEATEQFQALLEDMPRVLGADHPATLRTRSNLAHRLGEAGRVEESSAQFWALLEDMSRVLGVDHPDTLWARGELAHWLGEAGRVEEAAAHLTALLEDMSRVLGVDHPDTLWARGNLAHRLGEAGRVEEASAQFQPLLDDMSRVLGADHPDTLRTRSNLAHLAR